MHKQTNLSLYDGLFSQKKKLKREPLAHYLKLQGLRERDRSKYKTITATHPDLQKLKLKIVQKSYALFHNVDLQS